LAGGAFLAFRARKKHDVYALESLRRALLHDDCLAVNVNFATCARQHDWLVRQRQFGLPKALHHLFADGADADDGNP
jgi:hypothetical protein